jgi:hypothetical protein
VGVEPGPTRGSHLACRSLPDRDPPSASPLARAVLGLVLGVVVVLVTAPLTVAVGGLAHRILVLQADLKCGLSDITTTERGEELIELISGVYVLGIPS